MKETQVSVFVANRPGELARLTSQLASFQINITAISVSDSYEHGLVRMITTDPERAAALLREMGYGFVQTQVLTTDIPDRPGALAELCQELADAQVNIRYIYATVTPGGGVAMAVFSTDDDERAEQVLSG